MTMKVKKKTTIYAMDEPKPILVLRQNYLCYINWLQAMGFMNSHRNVFGFGLTGSTEKEKSDSGISSSSKSKSKFYKKSGTCSPNRFGSSKYIGSGLFVMVTVQ